MVNPSCDFGEWIETDEDGKCETEILQSTQCSLIAFVETETELERSQSVGIDTSSPDPISVTLPLPDTLWSLEEQEVFAAQLAAITWCTIDQRHPREAPLTPAQQALEIVDREAASLLHAWQGMYDAEEAAMHEHASRLVDPEEHVDALKEAFYQQY